MSSSDACPPATATAPPLHEPSSSLFPPSSGSLMGGLDLSPPDAACVVARHHRPKAAHHPHVRPKAAVPGTAAAAPCDAAPGRRWDQRHQGPPWGGTAEARGAGQQQAQQRVAYDDDGSDVDGDVDDDVGPAPAGKDAIICNLFDQRCTLLGATLESVEAKCQLLASRLALAEEERAEGLDRVSLLEDAVGRLRAENENLRDREQVLRLETSRLEAQLDSARLQVAYSEHRLAQGVAEERLRTDRMRSMRDDAMIQRDDALADLASAYADMDAMQATLADSAVYVRYLRKKVLELEVQSTRAAAAAAAAAKAGGTSGVGDPGPFSLSGIRSAIQAAVREAAQVGEEEQRKRIRQLQLRWHPDKNPVLTEFATEVTKIINEALAELEGGSAGARGAQGG